MEEIHTTLRKHLAKEEEQLFPLLLEHFTYAEQVRQASAWPPIFLSVVVLFAHANGKGRLLMPL